MKKINEQEEGESDSDNDAGAELRAMASDEGPAVDGKYKKLMEMGFMKRAADQQRERAREEAMDVLRELHAMEEGDDESENDGLHVQSERSTSALQVEKASANINNLLSETSSSVLTLPKLNSSVRVNGVVNISTKGYETDVAANPWLVAGSGQYKRKKGKHNAQLYANIDPLLEDARESTDRQDEVELPPRKLKRNQSSFQERANASSSGFSSALVKDMSVVAVDSDQSDPSLLKKEEQSSRRDKGVNELTKSIKRPERKPLLMQRSQEDLVQIAFAGPDYVKDFEDMKQKAVDEELEIDGKIEQINAQGNRSRLCYLNRSEEYADEDRKTPSFD